MPAGSAALGLDNMMGDMVTFLDFTAEASRNVDDGTDDATDNGAARRVRGLLAEQLMQPLGVARQDHDRFGGEAAGLELFSGSTRGS
jgi:hypothetical protein